MKALLFTPCLILGVLKNKTQQNIFILGVLITVYGGTENQTGLMKRGTGICGERSLTFVALLGIAGCSPYGHTLVLNEDHAVLGCGQCSWRLCIPWPSLFLLPRERSDILCFVGSFDFKILGNEFSKRSIKCQFSKTCVL